MTTPPSTAPYGPQSAAVRRFLVQFAGLGGEDRARVVAAYEAASRSPAWARAERALGETITRSDREAARDALCGPLLPLVRRADAPLPASDDEALATLDPIAEPALAALLTLVVRDLLDAATADCLLQPFTGIVADVGAGQGSGRAP